jgi:hypothetical protein
MMSKRRKKNTPLMRVLSVSVALVLAIAALFQYSLLQKILLVGGETKEPPSSGIMVPAHPEARTLGTRNGGASSDTPKATVIPLPKMQPNGGFILFLHVPKTGGTTIRDALMTQQQQQQLNVQYHFVSGRKLFEEAHRKAIRYLSVQTNRNRRTFILEIHGRDSPPLLELVEMIQTYRTMAQKNQIPMWTFSILREPLSFAVSYFNFFHVQRGPNPYFRQVEPTELNLLNLSLYNPQCHFLARGELSLRQQRDITITTTNKKGTMMPSAEECQSVQFALLNTMDWVGITEHLSEQTLALLRHVLSLVVVVVGGGEGGGNSSVSFPTRRVSSRAKNESLALLDLSPSTIGTLQEMSRLDQELYDTIQNHFSMGKWAALLRES